MKNIDGNDQTTDDVKILFPETNALPIECVAINKAKSREHVLFYETEETIYHNVAVKDMSKVLIIWSAYNLVNQTNFTYTVKIWQKLKKDNKDDYKIIEELNLTPGKGMAIPQSYKDYLIQLKIQG